ncbi:MAG: hypothetical protein WDN08_11265 [Rhizomicrobium sp.]
MLFRTFFASLVVLLALAGSASARGTLDSILPGIRAEHPGRLSDAEPWTDSEGRTHYRIKWMTPEGRILYFNADAETGRYSSGGGGGGDGGGGRWNGGGRHSHDGDPGDSQSDGDGGGGRRSHWNGDGGGGDWRDRHDDGGGRWNGGGGRWNGGGNHDWRGGRGGDGGDHGGWHRGGRQRGNDN